MKILTNCEGCKFETEDGCKLGRIEKFKQFHKVEKLEHHIIYNRICNAYNDTVDFEDPEEVYQYLKIPFEVYVVSNDLDKIRQSLASLKNEQICIGYTGKETERIKEHIFIKYFDMTNHEIEYDMARKGKSEFYIPLFDGETLDYNFLERCEKIYNRDLTPFVSVEGPNRLVLRKATVGAGPPLTYAPKSVSEALRRLYGKDKVIS